MVLQEASSFHRNKQMTKTELLRAKLEAAFEAMEEASEAFKAMPADSISVEDDLDILSMLTDIEMVRNGLIENSSTQDYVFETLCEKAQVKDGI